MIEAGKVFKKIVKKYKEKYGLSDELEAFEALLKHPSPHVIVKDLADAEDLKKLHKLHVKLYNELPGVFLEDSGVRSLLRMKGVPEEEIRKIEEDALAELRGEKEALPPPPKKNYVGEFRGVPLEPGDKVEKYPGTDIDIIRKADGRIIVPPHKDLKEIPHIAGPHNPDTIFAITRVKNIKRPEEFGKLAKEIREYIQLSKYAIDAAREGEPFDQIADDLETRIRSTRGKFAKIIGEFFVKDLREYPQEHPDYTHDHLISEVTAGIIGLEHIARAMEDIQNNPEKYGIRGTEIDDKTIRKIVDLLLDKTEEVHGYHHDKRPK